MDPADMFGGGGGLRRYGRHGRHGRHGRNGRHGWYGRRSQPHQHRPQHPVQHDERRRRRRLRLCRRPPLRRPGSRRRLPLLDEDSPGQSIAPIPTLYQFSRFIYNSYGMDEAREQRNSHVFDRSWSYTSISYTLIWRKPGPHFLFSALCSHHTMFSPCSCFCF